MGLNLSLFYPLVYLTVFIWFTKNYVMVESDLLIFQILFAKRLGSGSVDAMKEE